MIISTHIDPAEAEEFWSLAEPYITSALEATEVQEVTPSDLLEEIKSGEMALFLMLNKEAKEVVGAYTICFHDYPQYKLATVAQLGADNLDEALTCWDTIKSFAKYNGASKINIWGRRGWKKALADIGFKETLTSFNKDIS